MSKLKRTIGLYILILYGVGTIVGGGFYALIGKVAGHAGYFTPLSFVVSGFIALLTGCSYAELSSRYPLSAGGAHYIHQAFHKKWLTLLIGLLLILTGVVSAATLTVAIEGFIRDIFPLSPTLIIFLIVALLAGIAAWGIGESLMIIALITVIEVGALLYIFVSQAPSLSLPTVDWSQIIDTTLINGIFLASFLAFYSFIGFEDMVNLAEEVKGVRRTLPLGIILSLILTTCLYVLVSWAIISTTDLQTLNESLTPLAAVVQMHGPLAEWSLRVVSLLTGMNGSLVQIIMASRILYGLANIGHLPKFLSDVNPWTRTPLKATFLIFWIILGLALYFPLVMLAEITSAVILAICVMVNLSLVIIKLRTPHPQDHEIWTFPLFIPIIAALACFLFLVFKLLP